MLRKLTSNGFKFVSGLIYHNPEENAVNGLKMALKLMYNPIIHYQNEKEYNKHRYKD